MLTSTASVVNDLPLLSAEECAGIRESIMGLRASWLKRNPWTPFYTLGAASYLDAAADLASYHELTRKFNPILSENFAALYKRVTDLLAEALGAPVVYDPRLALPGFHIYLSAKIFEKPIASIHCDSQYQFHDWSGMHADLENPMSFTLSIALPVHGGGLNVWDLKYGELTSKSPEEIGAMVRARPSEYHAYTRGHLALHSGHIMHQAAPGKDVQPEDERITLQGHGILADGAWRLYW